MKRGSARPLTKDQIKIINAKASARFKEQEEFKKKKKEMTKKGMVWDHLNNKWKNRYLK